MRYKRLLLLTVCTFLTVLILTLGCVSPAQEQVMKGDTLLNQGQWDKASEAYSKALLLDTKLNLTEQYSKLATAYFDLGIDYANKGEDKAAIAYYDKAILLDPKLKASEQNAKLATAFYNCGTILCRGGQYDKALAIFIRAIDMGKNDAPIYNGCGDAYMGKLKNDKLLLDKAWRGKQYNNDDAWHLVNGPAGLELELSGSPQTFGPDESLVSTYSVTYDRDMDNAIYYYSKAIELDPMYTIAYSNRGLVYALKGYSDKAEADFKKSKE